MSRAQKAKNLVFGIGALGGTVAIFATVLEHLYGDSKDRNKKFNAQLSTEKLAFLCSFCFVVAFRDSFFSVSPS